MTRQNRIPHTCRAIDSVIEDLEDLRSANEELRALADQYASEADALEDELIEMTARAENAEDERDTLEVELQNVGVPA